MWWLKEYQILRRKNIKEYHSRKFVVLQYVRSMYSGFVWRSIGRLSFWKLVPDVTLGELRKHLMVTRNNSVIPFVIVGQVSSINSTSLRYFPMIYRTLKVLQVFIRISLTLYIFRYIQIMIVCFLFKENKRNDCYYN